MAWCWSGYKPLSEPMMIILLEHIIYLYASLGLNELKKAIQCLAFRSWPICAFTIGTCLVQKWNYMNDNNKDIPLADKIWQLKKNPKQSISQSTGTSGLDEISRVLTLASRHWLDSNITCYQSTKTHPCGAQIGICRNQDANTTAADGQALCITKSSATMILNLQDTVKSLI